MEQTQQRPGAITVEAKTLELALQKAALTLGVSQERLGHEVVKESGSGIMGLLTGRRIQISAWRKAGPRPVQATHGDRSGERRSDRGERAPSRGGDDRRGVGNGGRNEDRRSSRDNDRDYDRGQQRTQSRSNHRRDDDENQDSEHPAVPARQLTAEEIDSLKEEVRTFWQDLCAMMAGESVEVSAEIDGGRLTLRANSEYLAAQLTKNSKLAEAFEHILRKKPRHLRQELPFRIFVDINDIRKNREEELVAMAKDLSAQVQENGKPIVLNYKSPYERKIIHMALDQDEMVYTKSIGSGSGRKLMILPISEKGKNFPVEDSMQA